MKQLGDKGLEMIRASMKHPEIRGCWAEIGKPKRSKPLRLSVLHSLMLPFLLMIISVAHVNLELQIGNRSLGSFFDCKLRSHRIRTLHILWEIS